MSFHFRARTRVSIISVCHTLKAVIPQCIPFLCMLCFGTRFCSDTSEMLVCSMIYHTFFILLTMMERCLYSGNIKQKPPAATANQSDNNDKMRKRKQNSLSKHFNSPVICCV